MAYFVNPGISNTVSKYFFLTNMTVALVCSDDVCEFVFVLINGMSKVLKVAHTFAVLFCHNFEITRIQLDGISRNLITENTSKICQQNSIFIKL